MKLLQLANRLNKNWERYFVDETDYHTLVTETTKVLKPDGTPLMILLKNVIPIETTAMAWSVLKDYKAKSENRGTASGTKMKKRKKEDGTTSKILRAPKGWEVNSGIIGYFERTIRIPYCHKCAWNLENPDKWQHVIPLAQKVSALYQKHVPERWQVQKGFADKADQNFIIPGTVFSTLTVNKNFRTSCHLDAGDLPQGFSAMSVIREGSFKGAHLVFPDFQVACDLKNGDLILFDPHEFHGNTQIVGLTPRFQRCSIVYYLRENVQFCKSPQEELNYAKNRKLGDRLFDADNDSE